MGIKAESWKVGKIFYLRIEAGCKDCLSRDLEQSERLFMPGAKQKEGDSCNIKSCRAKIVYRVIEAGRKCC